MNKVIIICDDSLVDAERTKKTIEEYENKIGSNAEIIIYDKAESLVKDCKEGKVAPDIIFMDIELDDENGIETVEVLNEIVPNCYIIYLSNYLKYTLDTYQTNYFYYVMKSELEKRLPEVYKKIELFQKEKYKILRIGLKKNKIVAIKQSDILYFERKGRTTYIHMDSEIYETNDTLTNIEALIYEGLFTRCHNSYVVSMKYIKDYARDVIVMSDNVNIPVSRRYQQQVREQFIRWVRAQVL